MIILLAASNLLEMFDGSILHLYVCVDKTNGASKQLCDFRQVLLRKLSDRIQNIEFHTCKAAWKIIL